jgi:myo-inositol 2-dehydrogenase / D-chiro-inositol 1-dehydrogenase
VTEDLHVGVVGVGRIGAFHVRTLLALDGVGAVTVIDTDHARAHSVAEQLGASVTETPDALIERGVDALVIATTTAQHASLLRLAARAGIPAFCEKPVALDPGAMDDLMGEVAQADLLVQVGYQRRFDEGYRAARAAVSQGAVGTLLAVRAATHDPFPPAEDYIAVSGGIFRDLLIHDFDAIRFVTGRDIVEVYADGAVRETPWFDRYGDVDTAVAALRLSGGALAIVSGARHEPLGYDVRLEVFGTGDSIVVGSDMRTPLRSVEPRAVRPAAPAYRTFMDRFEAAYRSELAEFVATVRDGGPSACPLEEARSALLAAVAADRSRAERRPVAVEEVGLARAPRLVENRQARRYPSH